jgi:hypothetical protein
MKKKPTRKQMEATYKQLSVGIRATVDQLNQLLAEAKDARLDVLIYPLSQASKTIDQYADLFVSTISHAEKY